MNLHVRSMTVPLIIAMGLGSTTSFAQESEHPSNTARSKLIYESDQLIAEGRSLAKEERYAEAEAKLLESHRLVPSFGALFLIGGTHLMRCNNASAWAYFRDARDFARRTGDEREGTAEDAMKKVAAKLVRLRVVIPESSRVEGLVLKRDGRDIGATQWGEPIPIDPGTHVIEATAPGRKDWSHKVALDCNAQTVDVEVPPLELEPVATNPVVSGLPQSRSKDAPAAIPDLSHARQFGAIVRGDFGLAAADPSKRGAIALAGLSYGLGRHFEPSIGAVFAPKYVGAWAEATVFVLTGAFKPFIRGGMLVAMMDAGQYPAVQAAAGLQWDPIRHVGINAGFGIQYFLNEPSMPEYRNVHQLYFVPSIGVQGRL